jgi:DprA winged helix domain
MRSSRLNVAARRALGARVAAYVCTEANPPGLAKLRGPLTGTLPTRVRLTSPCSRCNREHEAELFDWRLPMGQADLAGARLSVEHDVVTIRPEPRRRTEPRAKPKPPEPKRPTARDKVMAALREHGRPMDRDAIAQASGVPVSSVGRVLTNGHRDGTIAADRGRRPWLYRVADGR